MTHSDPIADMLTRIRNGLLGRKKYIKVPHSKIKEEIAKCLDRLGFIHSVEVQETDSIKKDIVIYLKYVNKGEPAILGIRRQSKPGCRFYSSHSNKITGYPQHSISLYTTSEGIITDQEAKKRKLGGEVICTVW
ncbi:MAG: 30S ribosomal protein S8 [Candidatus Caenarcaniphilales bacterium]|nr:30S ribosomal protein S8 [Candidatus Caenarcaniphilales bacterium]